MLTRDIAIGRRYVVLKAGSPARSGIWEVLSIEQRGGYRFTCSDIGSGEVEIFRSGDFLREAAADSTLAMSIVVELTEQDRLNMSSYAGPDPKVPAGKQVCRMMLERMMESGLDTLSHTVTGEWRK